MSSPKKPAMRRVAVHNNLAYYVGVDVNGSDIYNIVPVKSPAPSGGYVNKEWILRVKKAEDKF